MATNHLGHAALVTALWPLLHRSASRVVVVVEHRRPRRPAHARRRPASSSSRPRRYRAQQVYANTKQANLLFAQELHRRARRAGSPVSAVAAHPGVSSTNLFRRQVQESGCRLLAPLAAAARQGGDAVGRGRRAADAARRWTRARPSGAYVGPTRLGQSRGRPELLDPAADRERPGDGRAPVGAHRAACSAPPCRSSGRVVDSALVGLVMLVGLAGVVVPVLPGTALVLAAGVGLGRARRRAAGPPAGSSSRSWRRCSSAGLVAKFALPGRRLSGELPRTTLLAGAAGAVLGLLVLPPFGLLLGGVRGDLPRRGRAASGRARRRGARPSQVLQGGRARRPRRAGRRRAHGRHLARRAGGHVRARQALRRLRAAPSPGARSGSATGTTCAGARRPAAGAGPTRPTPPSRPACSSCSRGGPAARPSARPRRRAPSAVTTGGRSWSRPAQPPAGWSPAAWWRSRRAGASSTRSTAKGPIRVRRTSSG